MIQKISRFAEFRELSTNGTPLASGLVAGEAMVGAILLPALAAAMDLLK